MKPGRIAFWLLAIAVIGYFAYAKFSPSARTTYNASTKSVSVPQDHPDLLKATDMARATVNDFITALKAPKPTQNLFSLKVSINDGTQTEHVWANQVTFDGNTFSAVIDSDPERVKTKKRGDPVNISPIEIRDWLYVDDGKLVGGFTIRAMRPLLTPEDLARFDSELHFRIE